MTLRVLRFLNLVASGVLAGVLVDFWAFTAPALASLSPEEVARVQQALDARHLLPAPVLYAVVNLTGLLVVVLLRRGSAGIFALSVTGLLCMAVGTAMTLVVKVPEMLVVANHVPAALFDRATGEPRAHQVP